MTRQRAFGLAMRARRTLLSARVASMAVGATVRRMLDVLVTGTALVILAPALTCVVLAVKLTSRGPVFFVQERIGQHGRRFPMYKFRTMVVNADALKDALAESHGEAMDGGVRFKMVRDPRITPLGRLMRKFSIDELPQLYNVLRGDMTLIGPRPPVWREVKLYTPRQLRRLEVRPGLTCLWQVRGRSDLSFEEQVELDLEYIDRTTPAEELRILLETVPAVMSGRGAY